MALDGVFARCIRKSMESDRVVRLMMKLLIQFLKNPMSKEFESLMAAYALHSHDLPTTVTEMFWAAEAYGNLKSVGEQILSSQSTYTVDELFPLVKLLAGTRQVLPDTFCTEKKRLASCRNNP